MNSAFIANLLAAMSVAPADGRGRSRKARSTKRRSRSTKGRVANAIRRRRAGNRIAAASRKSNRR